MSNIMFHNKQYLGDSVYAQVREDGQILVTTERGDGEIIDGIYLEFPVAVSLINYIKHTFGDRIK